MAKRQRERAELKEQTRDRRPTAIARYIRIPSSKMEVVLDLIRGKSYDEAAAILKNTNKSACPVILKVLNSAAANAENNLNILKDSLYVAECYSMAGPTLKRMMPRARGRADRILKRTCHIRVTLDQRSDESLRKTKNEKQIAKVTKVEKSTSKGEGMKTSTNLAKDSAKQKATPAKPKEVPFTQSERPLTSEPNAKKPLGTKSETVTKSKAESTVKKTTTVSTAKKETTGTAKKATTESTAKKSTTEKSAKPAPKK